MPVRVVDASALGALLFAEPDADLIVDSVRGCSLAAPVLLWYEMASICRKKLATHPESGLQILEAYSLLEAMDIHGYDVDYPETIALAAETGLTTYDCSYLWLAGALGAELVTLDAAINKILQSGAITIKKRNP